MKAAKQVNERKGAGFMAILLKTIGRNGCFAIMVFPLLYFYLTDTKGRKGIAALYRHLNQHSRLKVILLAFQNYWYFACSLLDRLTLSKVHVEKSSKTVNNGFEPGAIYLGAHFGDWLICASFFNKTRKIKMGIVMNPHSTPKFQKMIQASKLNITIIDANMDAFNLVMTIKEFIEQGGSLCFLGDRIWDEHTSSPISFLGEEVQFPNGPFEVARILKSPLYFFTSLRQTHFIKARYHVHAFKLWDGKSKQTTTSLMNLYVEHLAEKVKNTPSQWFNFFDYWQSERKYFDTKS